MDLQKYRPIFTRWESLRGRISFVVQGSQYAYAASSWILRICNLRNFCDAKVKTKKEELSNGQ
ncbi:MAG: hypothetical protein A2Y79_11845 [Deltaproteobacteria bacterium RBG_13_43_22]|nr:MAG: hypothetical protein A2Y79_11845 [Deltaproteobacteria bacterium RBG_13_43_22]